MHGRRRARSCAAAAALLVAWAGLDAAAHAVFARGSLRQFLQHSALAVRVELLSDARTWQGPDGDRQEYFRVRVLERLAGTGPASGELEFFPHAEGFPGFGRGDRALVFLERTAARPEFASLAGRFPWFSVQGAGEEWVLEGEAGAETLSWARAAAAWLDAGGDDLARWRALLVRGLRSDAPALRGDALLELVRAAPLPGMLDHPEAVAEVAPALDDPRLSLGRRAALFRLLEGRPGFDAAGRFARLVASARDVGGRGLLARQLAGVDRPEVAAWLAELAADRDPGLRRVAVSAQGARGAGADRALLERALADPDPGVARAAIRALGALGDPAARALLADTAAGDDPARARWAAAELRRDGAGGP